MADGESVARLASGPVGHGYQMQVGESLEDKDDFMNVLVSIFGGAFLLSIVLGTLAGWFMARQALRGVEEVSCAAIDVAHGKLDRRVEVTTKGEEIERLVDTFNTMVERLRGLISGMREMTDNIAHDLRSPLARIRIGAEQALSSAVTIEDHEKAQVSTLEECDRLLHMINTTLDVAETEVGAAELEWQETDLSRIVLDACELYEPLAEDKGISIDHEVEPGCRIEGNIPYLQRMLGNLLDNALKYTRPKGRVGVKLKKNGKDIQIKVSDTGVGIEPEAQQRVFDRFYRCDQSRSEPGCGLGLPLPAHMAAILPCAVKRKREQYLLWFCPIAR
jgi:signal transduction histidine kinase